MLGLFRLVCADPCVEAAAILLWSYLAQIHNTTIEKKLQVLINEIRNV